MILQRKQKVLGFTLLEVIVAMGILGLLSASLLLIFRSSLELSNTILSTQEKNLHRREMEAHIERHLYALTNESRISLSIDGGRSNVQSLIIDRPSHYFSFAGKDNLARKTIFTGDFNKKGLLNILQLSFAVDREEEQIDSSNDNDNFDKKTTLFRDLIALEWYFFDETKGEWVSEWDASMGNPKRIRFGYQHVDDEIMYYKQIWLQVAVITR
jgi:prepilin-type N-terminal cleavage/methylation domain-containing protein